jgi:RimJ/RimL family protein N-acetyltransferase
MQKCRAAGPTFDRRSYGQYAFLGMTVISGVGLGAFIAGLDGGIRMTVFEIPTLETTRLRLRAFHAGDLDAYAAMQANPDVMRHMVMGRTSTRAEVWRTMATSLGAWALRGHGMWACEKRDDGAFAGSVGIFQPLDWPEPEIAYSVDQPFW